MIHFLKSDKLEKIKRDCFSGGGEWNLYSIKISTSIEQIFFNVFANEKAVCDKELAHVLLIGFFTHAKRKLAFWLFEFQRNLKGYELFQNNIG